MELAPNRNAETWKNHFQQIHNHHYGRLGLASDRGTGLVKGFKEAPPDKPWYSDHFHKLTELCKHLTRIENQAYTMIDNEAFDRLNTMVRASSLVEMVNSHIRPYLKACKGQMTQETLNLMMFYHNHRRYKSGKRQDQAPIEILTGQKLDKPWVELLTDTLGTQQAA